MKHVLLALLILATPMVANAADSAPTPPPGGPPRRAPMDANAPAETQFKNIKVLTGVPAGDVRDSMEFITGALGVNCGFCHVRGGFEKDDKPNKDTARKTMRMVFGI